jgi:tRNA A-37 threonylcarbamoyl transferase component Bud32
MHAPERLGKYLIRRELGRGAMGVVYEGYDPMIERAVAIKVLRLDEADPHLAAELRMRFRREAQAAGRLGHPGIVGVYEYGEDAGADVTFIAMELVRGRDLKSLFDSGKRFTLAETGRLMAELLAALQHAHERGVVHRDIKPGNIILLDDGGVKVADFGIARLDTSELTQLGSVLGTVSHMSPEQLTGEAVDGRSDLYSCGVILYQLLTGERPFSGPPAALIHKVLHETPAPVSQRVPTLSAALDAVVQTAMAKQAAQRYPDARAFATALRSALDALALAGPDDDATVAFPPAAPVDATVVRSIARAPERRCRRRRVRRATRPWRCLAPPASPARGGRAVALTALGVSGAVVAGVVAWQVLGGRGGDDAPVAAPAGPRRRRWPRQARCSRPRRLRCSLRPRRPPCRRLPCRRRRHLPRSLRRRLRSALPPPASTRTGAAPALASAATARARPMSTPAGGYGRRRRASSLQAPIVVAAAPKAAPVAGASPAAGPPPSLRASAPGAGLPTRVAPASDERAPGEIRPAPARAGASAPRARGVAAGLGDCGRVEARVAPPASRAAASVAAAPRPASASERRAAPTANASRKRAAATRAARSSSAISIERGAACRAIPPKPRAGSARRPSKGSDAGQYELGLLHESGSGVPRDPAAALAWYRRAAAQGHARAQYKVGAAFENGTLGAANPVLAAEWYRKAPTRTWRSPSTASPPVSPRPWRLQGRGQGPGSPAEGGRRRGAERDGLRRGDVRERRRQGARPRPGGAPVPRRADPPRHQRSQPRRRDARAGLASLTPRARRASAQRRAT